MGGAQDTDFDKGISGRFVYDISSATTWGVSGGRRPPSKKNKKHTITPTNAAALQLSNQGGRTTAFGNSRTPSGNGHAAASANISSFFDGHSHLSRNATSSLQIGIESAPGHDYAGTQLRFSPGRWPVVSEICG